VIGQPAALLKLLFEEAHLLLLVWVQAVLDRLTLVFTVCLKHARCQAGRTIHPPTEAGGFLAPSL
jgi:hypothetical protein